MRSIAGSVAGGKSSAKSQHFVRKEWPLREGIVQCKERFNREVAGTKENTPAAVRY